MNVKKVRRKCNVRGCKNTESYAVSRTREFGNSIIVCKSCLASALGAIDATEPKKVEEVINTEAKAASNTAKTDVVKADTENTDTEKADIEKTRSRYRRGDKDE